MQMKSFTKEADHEDHQVVPLEKAVVMLEEPVAVSQFFEDLCTPAEWKAICERWKVAQLIARGVSYREISKQLGVSTATITRVGRALNLGTGYSRLLTKMRNK